MGPKRDQPSLAAAEVDESISLLEACAERVRINRAKQRNAASEAAQRDVLKAAEFIRDQLQDAIKGDRVQLAEIFGGSCERFWRLNGMLSEAKNLSKTHANDQRWHHLRESILTIQQVLKDLGTFKPFSATFARRFDRRSSEETDSGSQDFFMGGTDGSTACEEDRSEPSPSSESLESEVGVGAIDDVGDCLELDQDTKEAITKLVLESKEYGTLEGFLGLADEGSISVQTSPLHQFAAERARAPPQLPANKPAAAPATSVQPDENEGEEARWTLKVEVGSQRARGGVTWYILHVTSGTDENIFTKRYNDFRRLDAALRMSDRRVVCIPELPESGVFGIRHTLDIGDFNSKRKEGLQQYMNTLASQVRSWSDQPELAQFIGPDAPGQILRLRA